MSSSTPATLSKYHAIKENADFAADMVQMHFKQWLKLHQRLVLLMHCERHKSYTNLPLEVNASILRYCQCKPIRECVQNVLIVQRGLKKFEKQMKLWMKKERKHDKDYYMMSV
jgi:hypothetical protein